MIALAPNLTAPSLGVRLARLVVHERLASLRTGRLTVVDADETTCFGPRDAPLEARVVVRDPMAYARIAADGTIGAGEAFMEGLWDADAEDLVNVIRMLARESEAISLVEPSSPRLGLAIDFAKHLLRRNTARGSSSNIRAHYDLGNAFFALFLDPTMMYSAGIFETPEATMEEASVAKLDRICRKLRLSPGEAVVEIGTGWGGFAIHAARDYGVRVTTTTLSEQQYALATERVRAAGLDDRVTVLLCDYRALTGSFDALVSIEMIEAVGDAYLETYFETCGRLVKPDGRALIQVITTPDAHYEASLRSVDFIQKHVFPGSQIPSLARLATAWGRASDFRLTQLEDLTVHYERTCRLWRHAFLARRADVAALGYDETFLRMWEFYLAYCEGGFAERKIGDVQLVLARSAERSEPLMPRLD